MARWNINYTSVYDFRIERLKSFQGNTQLRESAYAYYATHPIEFINHWVDTYDPRNSGIDGRMATMPFSLFPRQQDLVYFLDDLIAGNANGLVQKSRDMGATWVCCAYSVWLWLFYPGTAVGWGSRKAMLVDNRGDASSIFEKMRIIIRKLPPCFTPYGFNEDHMPFMRIMNPENGSIITGEAGDNIGRGGRTKIFFKDESAHYEHPELIEAALGDNTNCQVDISSVNGTANLFYRKRKGGKIWAKGSTTNTSANIFILSWRDHPLKSQEWYDNRVAIAEAEGTQHILAKEVDMDYSAAVEGVIIPKIWINYAIDADIKLDMDINVGNYIMGFDVSDGGRDKDAYAIRKGIMLKDVSHYSSNDTGASTRKVAKICEALGNISVQYDPVGVGSGVKSESRRLKSEGLLSQGTAFIPWNAGASPQDKDVPIETNEGVNPHGKDIPTNGETYANLKAQAWWRLRLRFEKTYQMSKGGRSYPDEELISISSDLPYLEQLIDELSQPTYILTANLKILVDKKPDGTHSPNLADAVCMCYNPLPSNYNPPRAISKPRILS